MIDTSSCRPYRIFAHHHRCRQVVGLVMALFSLWVPWAAAAAAQPLEAFLRAAQKHHPDNRENSAASAQRRAEVDAAKDRLLPTLAVNGLYTRNQYEVSIGIPGPNGVVANRVTIQPYNQFDANATFSVPIVDLGAWERLGAAKANLLQSRRGESAGALDLERRVARAYYQGIAQTAVHHAAQRNLELAQRFAQVVEEKITSGTASQLDRARAQAELARSQQALAQAELAQIQSLRELQSLSGLPPDLEGASLTSIDDAVMPLESWMDRADAHPSLARADAQVDLARQQVKVAQSAWLPALSLNVQERLTNATGFAGRWSYFTAQAVVSWKADFSTFANIRTQEANRAGAEARRDRTRLQTQDGVYLAWHQIRASQASATAAQVQTQATEIAVNLAVERYSHGIATQLDVLTAQQDLFRAQVAQIQADADVLYARVALRLAAGQSLLNGVQP